MKKFKIDGKMFISKNNKPIPNIKTLRNTYRKIPDDKKVPVVFQTRNQYNVEYMRNQEKIKGIKFTEQEKREYLKSENKNLQGVQSRFTTYHNPYMEPKVVFFNDKKIDPDEFKRNAMHEYGHELWEKNPKIRDSWSKNRVNPESSPSAYGTTDEEEDFAESYAMYKVPTGEVSNPVPVSQINKRLDIIDRD